MQYLLTSEFFLLFFFAFVKALRSGCSGLDSRLVCNCFELPVAYRWLCSFWQGRFRWNQARSARRNVRWCCRCSSGSIRCLRGRCGARCLARHSHCSCIARKYCRRCRSHLGTSHSWVPRTQGYTGRTQAGQLRLSEHKKNKASHSQTFVLLVVMFSG